MTESTHVAALSPSTATSASLLLKCQPPPTVACCPAVVKAHVAHPPNGTGARRPSNKLTGDAGDGTLVAQLQHEVGWLPGT